MKGAALVVWCDGGGMHPVAASETVAPIDALADKIRKDRSVKIGKENVDVTDVAVIRVNGGDASIVRRFNCRTDATRERNMAEAKKPAK